MPDPSATDYPGSRPHRPTLVLPEWIEAGLLGALCVGMAFFVRDTLIGVPLHTPSVLGVLLVEGLEAARHTTNAPGAAALYNGVHFALWMVFGLVATLAMRRAEDEPAWRWMPISLGVFALGVIFGLDLAICETPLTHLHMWWGGIPGLFAVGTFLIWRHPGAIRR